MYDETVCIWRLTLKISWTTYVLLKITLKRQPLKPLVLLTKCVRRKIASRRLRNSVEDLSHRFETRDFNWCLYRRWQLQCLWPLDFVIANWKLRNSLGALFWRLVLKFLMAAYEYEMWVHSVSSIYFVTATLIILNMPHDKNVNLCNF